MAPSHLYRDRSKAGSGLERIVTLAPNTFLRSKAIAPWLLLCGDRDIDIHRLRDWHGLEFRKVRLIVNGGDHGRLL